MSNTENKTEKLQDAQTEKVQGGFEPIDVTNNFAEGDRTSALGGIRDVIHSITQDISDDDKSKI